MIALREAAKSNDCCRSRNPNEVDSMRAALRLMIRAPSFTTPRIADERSCGVALGICPIAMLRSGKMGWTKSVQSGQMAGADESLFADRMPATNVPCLHETLLATEHEAPCVPGSSRILDLVKSG